MLSIFTQNNTCMFACTKAMSFSNMTITPPYLTVTNNQVFQRCRRVIIIIIINNCASDWPVLVASVGQVG